MKIEVETKFNIEQPIRFKATRLIGTICEVHVFHTRERLSMPLYTIVMDDARKIEGVFECDIRALTDDEVAAYESHMQWQPFGDVRDMAFRAASAAMKKKA